MSLIKCFNVIVCDNGPSIVTFHFLRIPFRGDGLECRACALLIATIELADAMEADA